MTLRNALVGALAVASLAACGTTTPSAGSGKIEVIASTNVWGSVVKAVGGDEVDVKALLDDPSADPHSYESKPADAALVKDAKLVVFNGGGYDDFFAKLITSDATKKIEAFPLRDNHAEPQTGAPDADGHDHSVNEHVWYDLHTVQAVAEAAANELGAIAPDKKTTFEKNTADFTAKLEELEKKIAGIGQGKKVAATEPIAHYLLDESGAEDVTPEAFSKAIEEESDVPAAALAEMNQLVEGKQIAVLLENTQTENQVTKSVVEKAKTAGVPVVAVTETLPEGVTGYLDWMSKQVDELSRALKA
ncbi:metal ABC transporter solute-binding protein, Zn/Mn family [Lentzea flaviverrucosa]|uniref:Zinc/manganese transport system substrate-binding protein n=1 Tax=Lentzea flaviverrucosa TaxID=200379 RepID=A0A1H9X503_9PSEU|nr:zinc ABC transporter substrate-binding protein [Lentzea flaviverrucosa]RDI20839.1 zinc/manganese transport system substrate-binding protein [Lentzea flaviverrucosa]SES41230.1 zinc/manganese transport system substrate-binding protein [Lentzea flaviverrucosa]